MKYRKEKVYYITRKLYQDIRNNNGTIVLKKIRGCHGIYDESTEQIILDYRKEFIPTIIHEYLHKWYQNKSESWVRHEEKRIVNALSIAQIKNILKTVSSSL